MSKVQHIQTAVHHVLKNQRKKQTFRAVIHLSPPPPFSQTLVCTSAPLTAVLQLLPDPDGLHIALRCTKALSVMKLHRVRGQYGEFGGGQRTVNCKLVHTLQ